jgi:hypothetical protein
MLTDIVQTRLRTEQEIEQDLAYVAQLYVRGIPLREISLAIERRYGGEIRAGVHLIEDDVVRIRKEWINSALLEFDELRAAELEQLLHEGLAPAAGSDDADARAVVGAENARVACRRRQRGRAREITSGDRVHENPSLSRVDSSFIS